MLTTHLYKEQHLVACFFCKLKGFWCIATHDEKLAQAFLTIL